MVESSMQVENRGGIGSVDKVVKEIENRLEGVSNFEYVKEAHVNADWDVSLVTSAQKRITPDIFEVINTLEGVSVDSVYLGTDSQTITLNV